MNGNMNYFILKPDFNISYEDYKYLKDTWDAFTNGILAFYCLPQVCKIKVPTLL